MRSHTVAVYLRRYLAPEGMPHAPVVLELGVTNEDSVYVIARYSYLTFPVGREEHWIEGHFGDEESFANYLSEVVCEPHGAPRSTFRFDDEGVGWVGVVPNWRTPERT